MVLILVRALTIVEVDEHVSQARVQLVLHLLDVVLSVLAVVALLRLLLLLVVLVLILVILLLSVLLLIAIVALIAIIRVIGMLAFHGLVDVFAQVILAAFFSSVDSIFLGVVLVAVIVTVFIVSFDTVHVLLLALLLHLLLLLLRDSLAVVLINIIVHGNYGLLRLRVHIVIRPLWVVLIRMPVLVLHVGILLLLLLGLLGVRLSSCLLLGLLASCHICFADIEARLDGDHSCIGIIDCILVISSVTACL